MTLLLVCLVTMLCLIPASVLSHNNAGVCREKCDAFHDSGFLCVVQNRCTPPLDNSAKEACYAQCMLPYHKCPSACEEHYNQITAMCQAQCSGASSSCEDECFYSKMEKILVNPAEREVSILQPDPVLGRQSREAQDDWEDDTKRSPGGTSSMDMDDIFGEWAKKRDTKRSPGGTSSMDMDDIFGEWAKKRDSKRSPGSPSSMDVGDIFGIQRRRQDWSWEEGNSETDVYGDWKDKRQAETEIQ